MQWRETLALVAVALLPVASADAFDADRARMIEQGRALLQENRCNGSCHQGLTEDNDALSLYTRADRKARTLSQLERSVKMCVDASSAAVFPEDIALIVLALEHDHYKFK